LTISISATSFGVRCVLRFDFFMSFISHPSPRGPPGAARFLKGSTRHTPGKRVQPCDGSAASFQSFKSICSICYWRCNIQYHGFDRISDAILAACVPQLPFRPLRGRRTKVRFASASACWYSTPRQPSIPHRGEVGLRSNIEPAGGRSSHCAVFAGRLEVRGEADFPVSDMVQSSENRWPQC
jgi:hypothetical protein